MSLQQIARDLGIEVEARHIPIEELAEIDEAAACGTAAVASPIARIDDIDTGHQYVISRNGEPGPITTRLYDTLRGIQLGDIEDRHGWNTVL
jgi:branched-chain amino acid aminotransferase